MIFQEKQEKERKEEDVFRSILKRRGGKAKGTTPFSGEVARDVEKKQLYEIYVDEEKYINTEDSEITVTFRLYGRDWNKLLQSPGWGALEDFLHRKGNKDIQKSHKEK